VKWQKRFGNLSKQKDLHQSKNRLNFKTN
jgi:hypothetical protein